MLRRLFRWRRRKAVAVDPIESERKALYVTTRRCGAELVGLEWTDDLESWAHTRYAEEKKAS